MQNNGQIKYGYAIVQNIDNYTNIKKPVMSYIECTLTITKTFTTSLAGK